MNGIERFINVMEYRPVDYVPNWEAGVWGQNITLWEQQGLNQYSIHWDWFTGEERYHMDAREYVDVNFGMMPAFEYEVLSRDERYELIRDSEGRVRRALIEGMEHGTRASMDEFISFAVEDVADFRKLKKRYVANLAGRYPAMWRDIRLPGWKAREHVLILGRNCSTGGFYWRARDWMGTVNLSYAFYDQPELVHEMMEFIADFTMEVARPVLETGIAPEYVMISEDMSMKNGPLLSPAHYREFIMPHMRRMTEFFKRYGVKYVGVDTDGDCDALIPLLLECGVDMIWPIERVCMDPLELRRKYGRDLRLWGGVDKRELAKGPAAIDEHLKTLVPLVADGGFIPTVDHVVSPDVSLSNFEYYITQKMKLLKDLL